MPGVVTQLIVGATALVASVAGGAIGGNGARHHHFRGTPPSGNGAAGAKVALSQGGLDYLCSDVLEPILDNALGDMSFDDIDTKVDGVEVKINNLRTQDFTCNDCAKAALVTGSNIQVSSSTEVFANSLSLWLLLCERWCVCQWRAYVAARPDCLPCDHPQKTRTSFLVRCRRRSFRRPMSVIVFPS